MTITLAESVNIATYQKRLSYFKEETDLIQVRKLIHKTIEVSYPAFYDEAVVRYFEEINNNEAIRERARNGITLVYSVNHKIVGTGSLYNNELKAIYVDPAYQRKGIGKKIICSLFYEAEKSNMSIIEFHANPCERKFYQSFGFDVVKEEILWIDNNVPLDYAVMKKCIL